MPRSTIRSSSFIDLQNRRKERLFRPPLTPPDSGGEEVTLDVGDEEAEGEDLRRGEASLKQHLRKDEGTAPDGYYQERDEMILQIAHFLFVYSLQLITLQAILSTLQTILSIDDSRKPLCLPSKPFYL